MGRKYNCDIGMLSLTRRSVLGGVLGGVAAAGLGMVAGCPNPAIAAGTAAATRSPLRPVVVVFLRGGADMLSLFAQADDPDYVAARAPEMRVETSGPKAGIRIAQALAPAVDFRLHGEAAPLAELYQGGDLAVVAATGIADGTRSHFVAQDLMERGIAAESAIGRTLTGWTTRWLVPGPRRDSPVDDGVPAVATTANLPAALAGNDRALALADLQNGLGPPGGGVTADVLTRLYGSMTGGRGAAAAFALAGQAALRGLAVVDGHLPRGGDGKVLAYAAAGGGSYGDGEAARGLQTAARLLKMDIGLQLAWVDVGGWDTHEGQPGRFANATRLLARALAAFHNDTAGMAVRPVVVVMSEFGRRLRSNRSQGTDHGHGSAMLVLGQGVAGGRLLGRWPGLASAQLDRGVDLAVTTDYRAVLAAVLAGAGRAAGPAVFPGFTGPPLAGLL